MRPNALLAEAATDVAVQDKSWNLLKQGSDTCTVKPF